MYLPGISLLEAGRPMCLHTMMHIHTRSDCECMQQFLVLQLHVVCGHGLESWLKLVACDFYGFRVNGWHSFFAAAQKAILAELSA